KYLLCAAYADDPHQGFGARYLVALGGGESRLCCLGDRRMIRKTTANYESYRDSLLNLSSAMRRSVPASLEFPFVDGLDKFTVGLRLIYRKNKNPFRPRNPTQLAGSARRWRGDCKPLLYFQSIQERWITAGSIRFPNEGKRSQPKTRVGRDDGK